MRVTSLVYGQGKRLIARLGKLLVAAEVKVMGTVSNLAAHKKSSVALIGGAFLFTLPLFLTSANNAAPANGSLQLDVPASNRETGQTGDDKDRTTAEVTEPVNFPDPANGNTSQTTVSTTVTTNSSTGSDSQTYNKTFTSEDGNTSSSVNVSISSNGQANVNIREKSSTKVRFDHEDNSRTNM